ncbi:hypothetical protein BsWGS_22749 [Bradybaena similaris]
MGIHGLTGFIDNNQHLLHQHHLHDCSVVLDGNNFYHFLYYACHVQCSFGGDYDVYRKKIISTFESFKTCGIIPYVIMDGAYTVDGRKLRTSLSRASARIRLVDTMSNNQKGQALPVLAYETFMQTLNELGIHHATCQFEADNEIAVLANKLNCSVISNDSDFYIFDLNNGFLPLDYLDFRSLERVNSDGSKLHYLHCHKYHVDDFINSFDGLNRSVLPVFASLLGNDFINASAFSTFYSRVKVPKVVSKKFSVPPRLSKVISVLHWLNSQNDTSEFADIKAELLEFIKPRRKIRVEKMFESSVNGYVDVENFQGIDLFQFFAGDSEQCNFSAADDFRSYNGELFPDWFVKAACCGEITPSTLNCTILHRVIILTQVEDLSQASSFQCSLGLRRVLYGVLLQEDLKQHSAAGNKLSVSSPFTDGGHGRSQGASSDVCASSQSQNVTDELLASGCLRSEERSDGFSSDGTIDSVMLDKKKIDSVMLDERINSVMLDERINSVMLDKRINSVMLDERVCDVRTEARNTEMDLEKGSVNAEKEIIAEGANTHDANAVGDCLAAREAEGDCVAASEVDSGGEVYDGDVVVEEIKADDVRKKAKQFCVEEYTRVKKNLLKTLVEPLYCVGTVSVPGLADLPKMAVVDRKLVLAAAMGVDLGFMAKFSDDLQLFAACLVAWARNVSPKITRKHLETVIVGVLFLRVFTSLAERKHEMKGAEKRVDDTKEKCYDDVKRKSELKEGKDGKLSKRKCERNDIRKGGNIQDKVYSGGLPDINCEKEMTELNNKMDIQTKENVAIKRVDNSRQETELTDSILSNIHASDVNIARLCSQVNIFQLENIKQNLHKHHSKAPVFNNKNHYVAGVSHAFAQLQACMVDAINLNKLLQFPAPTLRPADLVNGTFLYNFYTDISARANPDLFLEVMFDRSSEIISSFTLFRDVIINYVGESCFDTPSSLAKKTRTRKAKSEKKHRTQEETRKEKLNDKETVVNVVAGFDVANMFGVLSMDDF